MIAWHIFDGDPYEASLLVFAASRNRARYIAYRYCLWDYQEYVHVSARRAPPWDGLFDCEKVVETNEDLPAGAPPFYNDE